jgi:hypothetical protein
VKVAVLNPELIPEFVDIVIGDYVYELQVQVESETEELNPLPIDMDTQPEEDGTKKPGKDAQNANDTGEPKSNLGEEKSSTSKSMSGGKSEFCAKQKKNTQDPEPVLLEAQADPIIAQHEGKPICAAQPMALVGDQQLRANGPEAEKGLSGASPGNKSRPMFQLELAASESTRAWVAKAFDNSATDKFVTPKSPKSPSKLTMENAMPKSAIVTPSRKSKRSTAFADQDSIEKAAKL